MLALLRLLAGGFVDGRVEASTASWKCSSLSSSRMLSWTLNLDGLLRAAMCGADGP